MRSLFLRWSSVIKWRTAAQTHSSSGVVCFFSVLPAEPSLNGKPASHISVKDQLVRKTHLCLNLTVFPLLFLQQRSPGKVLFDLVCAHLNLTEGDYFGLEYQDHRKMTVRCLAESLSCKKTKPFQTFCNRCRIKRASFVFCSRSTDSQSILPKVPWAQFPPLIPTTPLY